MPNGTDGYPQTPLWRQVQHLQERLEGHERKNEQLAKQLKQARADLAHCKDLLADKVMQLPSVKVDSCP